MMKRLLYSLSLLAMVLSGCNPSNSSKSEPQTQPSTQSQEANNKIAAVILPSQHPNNKLASALGLNELINHFSHKYPATIIYDNGETQHINPTDRWGFEDISISPNRSFLALADPYNINILNNKSITVYKKEEDGGSLGSILINSKGDFISIDESGSKEVNGKLEPFTYIGWRANGTFNQHTVPGDVIPVLCHDHQYGIERPEVAAETTRVFDISMQDGTLANISSNNKAAPITPYLHKCNNDGTISIYDGDRFLTINKGNIIYQSEEIPYDPTLLSSYQALSQDEQSIYYATSNGVSIIYNKNTNTASHIDIFTLIPKSKPATGPASLIQGNHIFSISQDINSGRWITSEIDLTNQGSLKFMGHSKFLDTIYSDGQIGDLYIFDVDAYRSWMRTQQDSENPNAEPHTQ